MRKFGKHSAYLFLLSAIILTNLCQVSAQPVPKVTPTPEAQVSEPPVVAQETDSFAYLPPTRLFGFFSGAVRFGEYTARLNQLGAKGFRLDRLVAHEIDASEQDSINTPLTVSGLFRQDSPNTFEYEAFAIYSPADFKLFFQLSAQGYRFREHIPLRQTGASTAKLSIFAQNPELLFMFDNFVVMERINGGKFLRRYQTTSMNFRGGLPLKKMEEDISKKRAAGDRPVALFFTQPGKSTWLPEYTVAILFENSDLGSNLEALSGRDGAQPAPSTLEERVGLFFDQPEYKLVATRTNGNFKKDIAKLAQQGYRLLSLNMLFAMMGREAKTAVPTTYTWMNSKDLSFSSKATELTRHPERYQISGIDFQDMEGGLLRSRLLFSPPANQESTPPLYDYILLELDGPERILAENQKETPLQRLSRLVKAGYSLRDLIITNGATAVLERPSPAK